MPEKASTPSTTTSAESSDEVADESDLLLFRRTSVYGEYESIGVAVVEYEHHQPVLMHDYSGPVLTDHDIHDDDRASLWERLSCDDLNTMSLLDELPPSDTGGVATISSEIVSMTKNLIGCGALSLSNGIARCANSDSALLAANVWIVLFGLIFGYFCWLIAKVCQLTGRTTYRGIWEESVGHKGSVAVSVANALKAAMADLAFAAILSDTLKSLFLTIGLEVPRAICLLLVTLGAILPLCLLKNLHVLAPFSIVGTAGVIFAAIVMTLRYLDGSYLPGGNFYGDVLPMFQPNFGTTNQAWSTAILPFVCMVYEAYVMHYNSARFYTELKERSLPRFAVVVGVSFGIAAVVYMVIATVGFLTFGGNSSGFILNNYSPHDSLANISRITVGISTLTSYPIVFFGVRDGCMDILSDQMTMADQTPEKLNNYLTYVLLAILTLTAVFVTDLGVINAVGGGLVATAIVFVFPTLMFHKALSRMAGECIRNKLAEFLQVYWAWFMTLIGVVIGVIGAYTAVATGTNDIQ